VVAGQLMTLADQDVASSPGHLHHVVRHQTMSPLDQVQYAFALADPGTADKQESNPVHIREGAVQSGARRERLFEQRLDTAVELRRLELAQQQRHPANPGEIEQLAGYLLPLGHEDAGQVEVEERLEPLASLFGSERIQVTDFGFAQDVQPARGETGGVTGQRQAGARDLRVGNGPVQPQVPGQRREL
jgi:hypothetical protein